MDVQLKTVAYCVLLIVLLHVSVIKADFFMVSNTPEIDRYSTLRIYAINYEADAGDFVITKEGGLPSDAVQSGSIMVGAATFGCFLQVAGLKRQKGLRYGQYTGTFTVTSSGAELEAYTFVKPKTGVLDTRSVQTRTIYPAVDGSTGVDPVTIGVGWSPGCRKIIWCKGKRRITNTGPKLTLTDTDDAGLYTIARPKRSKRGWFVQILVIAAKCPILQYYVDSATGCMIASTTCENGGVRKDEEDICICPPSFTGDTCNCASSSDGSEIVLGNGLTCGDLPGGNPKCKGHLICYGDNYGCKCSTGWWGNACDRACPKGKYGANCSQDCPSSESDCNRFYGPSTNLQDNIPICMPTP